MLGKVVKESKKMALSFNPNKTDIMVISRKAIIPTCQLKVKQNVIKQVHKFKYLGSWITSDGKYETEIKSCIAQAKTAFQKMRSIFRSKNILQELTLKLSQCYIEPTLMYSCASWTLNSTMKRTIEATEMWFPCRMLRISLTEKKSNDEVWKWQNVDRAC